MPYLNPHPNDAIVYCCTECESSSLWDRQDIYVTCQDCGHRMAEPDVRERRSSGGGFDQGEFPNGMSPEMKAKIKQLREGDS